MTMTAIRNKEKSIFSRKTASRVKSGAFRVVLYVLLSFELIWVGLQYAENATVRSMAPFKASSSSNKPARRQTTSADRKRRELKLEVSSTSQAAANIGHFSSLCEWAAQQNPIRLWVKQLPSILAASQLSLDEYYAAKSITAQVLREITGRLPRSVKTLPTTDISKVMAKLERRYQYLLDPDSFAEAPPPVTITILGGSVTLGNNCYSGIKRVEEQRCAWPTRLDQLIHNLVKSTLPSTASTEKLVTIHSLAMGATNTVNGKFVLEYDLWPGVPDILINAYSTNDNHLLTTSEMSGAKKTLRDEVFTVSQNFVRALYHRGQCSNKTIILYWLDDYLGNTRREILVNYELAQSLHVLSNFYGFGFVSYADAVRDTVYSNTTAGTFSPADWYNRSNLAAGMREQIHPGQEMHMATAWIIAYNLFSTVVTHCSMESSQADIPTDETINGNLPATIPSTTVQSDRRAAFAPLDLRTSGIPPLLTKELTLDLISEQWQIAAATIPDCGLVRADTKKCPFSWVSGMIGGGTASIKEHFKSVVKSPVEWDVVDDTNKYKFGWMPLANIAKPKLVMEFNLADHAADNIHSVVIFFLKSYGWKWKGSTVTVTIERKVQEKWVSAQAAPIELTGTHNKRTSETYTQKVHLLHQDAIATAVRLTLTLTGGKTFKLMGVAVCQ